MLRCRASPGSGADGHTFPERAGPLVEPGGQLMDDSRGTVWCPLRPCHVVPGELRQGELLQTSVQNAGDGPGAVHRRGGDLLDQGIDAVPGELGGAEPLVQGRAGVLAVVPEGRGFGEPGLDPLIDLGVQGLPFGGGPQGEQVAGSARPFLGLADLLDGGRIAIVASWASSRNMPPVSTAPSWAVSPVAMTRAPACRAASWIMARSAVTSWLASSKTSTSS